MVGFLLTSPTWLIGLLGGLVVVCEFHLLEVSYFGQI